MKYLLKDKYFGLLLSLIVLCFYNFFFYNNYAPITEGWFSTYVELMNRNQFPYKDFYFFLTPFYLFVIQSFQYIFGNSFYALRIFGIFVILLISLFLYLILHRKFSAFPSFVATLVGIVFYQSGVAHLTYDFTQILSLFIIAYTYFVLCYSDYRKDRDETNNVKYQIFLFLSGFFASLAFLTKQSNGAVVLLFSYFIVFLASSDRGLRLRFYDLLTYLFATLLPIILVMIWLSSHAALHEAFNQIFNSAIAAKGGLNSILFGWLHYFNIDFFRQLLKAILFFSPILFLKTLDSFLVKSLKKYSFINEPFKIFIFSSLAISIFFFSYYGLDKFNLGHAYKYLSFITFFVNVITLTLLFTFLTIYVFFKKNMKLNPKIFSYEILIAGLIALSIFIANGTSGGISEISSFLVLSYLVAFGLSIKDKFSFIKAYFSFLSLVLILFLVSSKFFQPYSWWYVSSGLDLSKNVYSTNIPVYTSMKLSLEQKNIYENIIKVIDRYTAPSDDIFAFPNISGLYFIADRYPRSRVIVPWFDFLPDDFAVNESVRVTKKPPKILINLDLPEEAWLAHEQLFRNAKPLGQRAIRKAILSLTEIDKKYSKKFSSEISPNCHLDVWVLK
jgi:hypothetical protein